MTRTQKLGLCTWLPEDPVNLAQMNDNFSRLDLAGGRALHLAEAGMLTLGGMLAAQAHTGGLASYTENIMVDAFRDAAQFASYEGLLYRNNRLELLTAGASDGTITFPTTSSGSASGAFHPSNAIRSTSTRNAWVDLCQFYPDAYGTLTNLTLQTKTSAGTTESTATKVKLSIWDADSGEMLAETDVGTIIHTNSKDQPVNYTLNLLLDPNHRYILKAWISQLVGDSMILSTIAFSVTPVVYSTGTVTMTPMTIPAGTGRSVLLVHATQTVPQIALKFGESSFAVLTPSETKPDVIYGSTSCTLYRYAIELPDGAQRAQLRLTLPGSGCKIYDFALIML